MSAVYTDWWPFLFAAAGFLVLLGVLVAAALCARVVTRRAPTPTQA